MSRTYRVSVTVKAIHPRKVDAVTEAILCLWPVREDEAAISKTEDGLINLGLQGVGSLGGGKTTEEFAKTLARRVWGVHGNYVSVSVITEYLDEPPTDVYSFGPAFYIEYGPIVIEEEE